MMIMGLALLLITVWALAYASARAMVWIVIPPILLTCLYLTGLMTPSGILLVGMIYALVLYFT
ncbi:MAG: hypothetical protein ABW068_03735 [Candidatus Thiodiazotropha sp.]